MCFREAVIRSATTFNDHERHQIIDGRTLAEHRVLLHFLVQSLASISKAHDLVSLGANRIDMVQTIKVSIFCKVSNDAILR
jgi:hypothetical protein